MTDLEIPKNPKEVAVKLPEKPFLEKPDPEKSVQEKGKEFFQKYQAWFVIGAIIVAVLLAGYVWTVINHKKKDAPVAVLDEKRTVITAESMEQAIDASLKGKKTFSAERESIKPVKHKRKFDTAISVFVKNREEERKQTVSKPFGKETKLGLSAGTKIPAVLPSRVFSFNVEAPVIAVLEKDFSFQDKTVIPKGSKFLGNAAVLKSVDRINVRFDLLILPDGREIKLRALALSEDGSSGIRGKVDRHTDKKILKAIGESLIAGAALFAGSNQSDPFSLEDQVRLNLTQNFTNEAARDLRSSKTDTSITVEAYTPIQVMLLEAV